MGLRCFKFVIEVCFLSWVHKCELELRLFQCEREGACERVESLVCLINLVISHQMIFCCERPEEKEKIAREWTLSEYKQLVSCWLKCTDLFGVLF